MLSGKRKIKKVFQECYFSDLRAGGTKRAGDVTVEILKKSWPNSSQDQYRRILRAVPSTWSYRTQKKEGATVLQYSRFLFSGFESRRYQESRWCNRRNLWKKFDQTLYKINTYHSPHVNYAWKRPEKLLCGPPWPSFFIDFRNLSSDLTRRHRKKTWTGVPTVLRDPAIGIIRPS